VERIIQSAADMEAFGAEWAGELDGGEALGLIGGLGAGKTHFCKGLVGALGHSGDVTSPTFGLVHEYRGGRLPVFHWDFYRLGAAAELPAAGWDELLDEAGITLVEWADRFPEWLPPSTRWLRFEILADGARRVTGAEPPRSAE
jgi:tRNA threonylcarbamoyladenosine biosynthesis protein TsaE